MKVDELCPSCKSALLVLPADFSLRLLYCDNRQCSRWAVVVCEGEKPNATS